MQIFFLLQARKEFNRANVARDPRLPGGKNSMFTRTQSETAVIIKLKLFRYRSADFGGSRCRFRPIDRTTARRQPTKT